MRLSRLGRYEVDIKCFVPETRSGVERRTRRFACTYQAWTVSCLPVENYVMHEKQIVQLPTLQGQMQHKKQYLAACVHVTALLA